MAVRVSPPPPPLPSLCDEHGPPRALIHVGPHKCASTTVQNFLFDLRDDLAKDCVWQPYEFMRDEGFAHAGSGNARAARRCGLDCTHSEYSPFLYEVL